jgi:alpha-galactosidase
MVGLDKRIRDTVQNGNLFRLLSPRLNDVTANQYVSPDSSESVLFAFRHSQQYRTNAPVIYPQGLDAKALYHLESPDGKLAGPGAESSGAYLMGHGVQLTLAGDYDSTVLLLHRIP